MSSTNVQLRWHVAPEQAENLDTAPEATPQPIMHTQRGARQAQPVDVCASRFAGE